MKSHKYWSLGALFCMLGCIYSGIRKSMTAHKYLPILHCFVWACPFIPVTNWFLQRRKKSLNQIIVRIVKQKTDLYSSKTKLLESIFLQQHFLHL